MNYTVTALPSTSSTLPPVKKYMPTRAVAMGRLWRAKLPKIYITPPNYFYSRYYYTYTGDLTKGNMLDTFTHVLLPIAH